MRWLLHWLGMDSASGTPYLAWSGWGSDITEVAVVGGLLAIVRKHNCAVRRCWRVGRHATDGGHVVCARHMPGGAPSHADVIAAHDAAKETP